MLLEGGQCDAIHASGAVVLSDQEFARFQALLAKHAGIRLGPSKRALVCGRLASRLRELGLRRYGAYLDRIDRGDDRELEQLLDRLTTNETHFFREPRHFDFLRAQLRAGTGKERAVRIWSAACSSGEEPYTIAMVLADELGGEGWEVLGSDINTRVIADAQKGVYANQRIKGIPEASLKRYCVKGVRSQAGRFAIGAGLRRNVRFARINLNEKLPNVGEFDFIFLRNVMIYFDDQVKRQVVEKLLSRLRPGGHLLIGHSETLNGLCSEVDSVQPTVYRKR